MTFLTILGITEIPCSFNIVLEGKTGKEIPESSRLDFSEKFPANKFALSDAEDNIPESSSRGGIADLPLLRTLLAICQKSQKPSVWNAMDSLVLLAYASLTALRTLLQQLLACLNFTLDSEDLSFWCKRKKWSWWTMAAAQAPENHGDEWHLTWYFRWGVHISIPTLTHSQNSLATAEALNLKISLHETSLKWSGRLPQSAQE